MNKYRIRRKRGRPHKMKYVRVDHKTVIEVRADKPDEDAVRDFLARLEECRPGWYAFGGNRKYAKKNPTPEKDK